MKPHRQPQGGPAEDRGAALLLVLIIVTVIGLAGAALLTFSDTSIRTTVALRDQAAAAYAADGAAQVVISEIQSGKLDCSSTTPTVVTLGSATSPFYTPVQSQVGPLNASITCVPDPKEGATTASHTTGTGVEINPSNNPWYALLTVGTSTSDYGQKYAGNHTVCISGGSVVSNSTINVGDKGSKNSLSVGINSGTSDCPIKIDDSVTVETAYSTGCNGSADDDNTADFAVTPCKHRSSPVNISDWKGFAPIPVAPITRTNPHAICTSDNSYAAFLPGYYSDATLLNRPCFGMDKKGNPTQTAADFEWFSPGTYYFDFGSDTWSWPTTLVAGTPLDSSGTAISTVDASKAETLDQLSKVTSFPGSCAAPSKQSTYPGVEFVFGGSSTVSPSSSGSNEICATYSATSPPVAIYGVSSEVIGANSLVVAGGSAAAETLCDPVNRVVQPCTSSSSGTTQSLINDDNNGKSSFFIQGFTYAPSARISLTLHKGKKKDEDSAGQLFGWGLVARSIDMTVTGSTSSAPFIVLRPAANAGTVTTTTTTPTIRYISVWTCKASATSCPQTDARGDAIPPDVRIKVQTSGSTMKVLSWSVQR